MKAVLDASAVLAFLQDEPGSNAVEKVLEESCISSVNWSEVIQKSLSANVATGGLREEIEALGLVILNFTPEHADVAGKLWKRTRRFGFSLGDRACLSLGMTLKIPVITADKAWKKAKLPIQIDIIR